MRPGVVSGRVSTKLHPLCQDKYIQIAPSASIPRVAFIDKMLIFMIFFQIKDLTTPGYMYIFNMTLMGRQAFSRTDGKKAALRAANSLHPHPEAVRDDAFLHGDFFDPDDLVQVKYEMLKRHRLNQRPVAEVARTFGTSRQAFYSTKAIFDTQGLPGLIPKRRGPRRAHKCTDEVLDFAEQWKNEHKGEGSRSLADAIKEHFGVGLNPRSVDRALTRRKKKRRRRQETV